MEGTTNGLPQFLLHEHLDTNLEGSTSSVEDGEISY